MPDLLERPLTAKERATFSAYSDPNSDSYLNATSRVISKVKNLANEAIRKANKEAISPELKAKLTPEWILSKLTDEVEIKAKRSSDRIKALELLGKYKELALFKENSVVETIEHKTESELDLDQEFKEHLARIDDKTSANST
jgi:hypothetical protein